MAVWMPPTLASTCIPEKLSRCQPFLGFVFLPSIISCRTFPACRAISSPKPRTTFILATRQQSVNEEQDHLEENYEEDGSHEEEEEEGEVEDEDDEQEEDDELKTSKDVAKSVQPKRTRNSRFEFVGNKEKKELRAYAHQLGKDITTQHIGKWGVSSTVSKSLSDSLEANELIKVRVLDNCPSELDEIIFQLEETTECQVVGKVGRILLLYRPSVKKVSGEKGQEKPRRKPLSRLAMSAGRKHIRLTTQA